VVGDDREGDEHHHQVADGFLFGGRPIRLRRTETTLNERPKPVSERCLQKANSGPEAACKENKTYFLP